MSSFLRNHPIHHLWDLPPLNMAPKESIVHDTDTSSMYGSPNDFFHGLSLRKPDFLHGPRVDIVEGADAYHLTAELPGVKKDDVQINVIDKERRLTISGTMRSEYHVEGGSGSTEAASKTTGEKGGNNSKGIAAAPANTMIQGGTNSSGNKLKAQHRPIILERTFGSFSRTFVMPDAADLDSIKARFQDGLLKLNVAKKQADKQRPRAVTIEDSDE